MTILRRGRGSRPASGSLLHIGCGEKILPGWVNIDLQALPGVDLVADVTRGLEFTGARAIYAEHFLEHLAIGEALDFLSAAHRALAPGGWLRLSTPNLDWVWETHYRMGIPPDEKRLMALGLNRAFQGWGHRFLWNPELLEEALAGSGFPAVRWCRYGESELELFRGIEHHGSYPDTERHQHVIIAEAAKGDPRPERMGPLWRLVREEFLAHLQSATPHRRGIRPHLLLREEAGRRPEE
jgi:hypothetical protein